ncbi:MAG: ABC transporter permease [Thermoanaerobaculia bacterium]
MEEVSKSSARILSLEVAWRYLKRPTDKLVSAVGVVSILGLVIGVMALVISMALMTGYRQDLQKKLLGGNAELFVYSVESGMDNPQKVLAEIRGTPGVREASPVLFQQALASSESLATGTQVMVKGIEPSRAKTSPMLVKIIGPNGFHSDGYPGVSVGKYLAQRLGVSAGSPLTITVPSEHAGSFLPQSGTFMVSNVFDTGFYEYDSRWIFLDLAEARQLTGSPNGVNLVEIRLQPSADLDIVEKAVNERTGEQYAVTDWREMNHQLFSMLKIQQLVLFIVIGLIVFVSTFNIVSTLIMTVHEKRKEIGILMSMGGESRFIRGIFIWYGTLVGLIGTATGVGLGVIVCWIITRYHLVSFPREIAEVYFVSSIPFVTKWSDLAIITGFAVVVSCLATILPSARAARLSPSDALRYE